MRRSVIAGAVLTAVVGCGADAGPMDTTASFVALAGAASSRTPVSLALDVGQTHQLQSADVRSLTTPTWHSSAPAVAVVNSAGLITAISPGTAVVTGSSRQSTFATTVTVRAPQPIETVSVSFDQSPFFVGATRQLTARLLNANGQEVSGTSFTFVSSNSGVVSIGNTGLVTAVSVGSATLTASAAGRSSSVSIAVVQPAVNSITVSLSAASVVVGQGAQATAEARDISGNLVAAAPITWAISSGSATASIGSAGWVTSVAAGTATVRGCYLVICGTASLTVSAPPARTGLTYQLTAARFQPGSAQTVISAGIPLAPGVLQPSQLGNVRIFRNDVEQNVYVEELGRRHTDGSVRSVLVQVDGGLMTYGQQVAGWRVSLDQGARQTSARSKVAIDFSDVPAGMLYYTDPIDRVASNLLLGPTKTIAESPAREPFTKFHSLGAMQGNNYSGAKGALDEIWSMHQGSNFHAGAFFNGDAGWANLVYFTRGGGVEYLERFLRYARVYVLQNDRGGGIEWQKWYRTPRSHYWITGDTRSVDYMREASDAMWAYHNSMFLPGKPYELDQRAYAQDAGLNLSFWLTGGSEVYRTRALTIFDTFVRLGMSGPTLGVHYYADQGMTACKGQKDYMTGLMHSFMIEYVENADPARRSAFLDWLQVGLERLWEQRSPGTSQIYPEAPGMKYFWSPQLHAQMVAGDTSCDKVYKDNGLAGSSAREGYNIEVFAYYGAKRSSALHRSRAEELFASHVRWIGLWAGFGGLQAMYNDWSIFGYMP